MEIGDKSVYALELIGRVDEYIRISVVFGNIAVKSSDAFKSAAGSGADSDNSAALCLCLIDEVGSFLRQMIVLAVHFVVEDIILLDRAESAKTDVQGNESSLYATGAEVIQHFGSEVQTGSRRCG